MIKKVAAIHDLSGIGRCSLSVAITTLSALGLQVCPMPTAILSNQTGFSSFSFLDFTPYIEDYMKEWKKIGYHFDCIYSGFLGSSKQVDQMKQFVEFFKEEGTLVVVDPVMGDEGQLYTTYDESYIGKMRELISYADVITPNYTEFLLLLGQSQKELTEEEIYKGAKELTKLGPTRIVVTGRIEENRVYNYGFDAITEESFKVIIPFNQKSYSGTGDLMASIVSGMLAKEFTLEEAVKKAADFIWKAVVYTEETGIRPEEGIIFEHYLGELIQL